MVKSNGEIQQLFHIHLNLKQRLLFHAVMWIIFVLRCCDFDLKLLTRDNIRINGNERILSKNYFHNLSLIHMDINYTVYNTIYKCLKVYWTCLYGYIRMGGIPKYCTTRKEYTAVIVNKYSYSLLLQYESIQGEWVGPQYNKWN